MNEDTYQTDDPAVMQNEHNSENDDNEMEEIEAPDMQEEAEGEEETADTNDEPDDGSNSEEKPAPKRKKGRNKNLLNQVGVLKHDNRKLRSQLSSMQNDLITIKSTLQSSAGGLSEEQQVQLKQLREEEENNLLIKRYNEEAQEFSESNPEDAKFLLDQKQNPLHLLSNEQRFEILKMNLPLAEIAKIAKQYPNEVANIALNNTSAAQTLKTLQWRLNRNNVSNASNPVTERPSKKMAPTQMKGGVPANPNPRSLSANAENERLEGERRQALTRRKR